MEKKNHLFDESIEEKIKKERGREKDEKEKNGIGWQAVLMGAITILFAASILLRYFVH
ncbi:MAG: hypothetical protein IKI12_03755 [Lachnospiraceae bacterium]|nr:hypothetical protein [Lachnospiraceae bacterium]